MKTETGKSQYASCPQLDNKDEKAPVTVEEQAIRQITTKYDSYQELMRRRASSLGCNEDASRTEAEDTRLQVSDHERLQLETFFKGLNTQVFVCGSLANLYFGSTSQVGEWELRYVGIPVVVLNTGETRSRRRRHIQILLAERGTCFTLWQDTIDNLTSYRVAGEAFHTMHVSSDHTQLAGLSFDSEPAAAEMWAHIEKLVSDPENISLSAPGSRGRKPKRTVKPVALPSKANISQPCCFQHITSVEARDHDQYVSLKSLVPLQANRSPTSPVGTEL